MGNLLEWITGPPAQIYLFQDIRRQPESGVWAEISQLLRHPLHSMREAWNAPRTRASLFQYLEKPDESPRFEWRDLLKDLFTSYRFALFIPSLWADQAELSREKAVSRTRRIEAGMASLVIHATVTSLAIYFALARPAISELQPQETVVLIRMPMHLPSLETGEDGGGGGGGGKREVVPPSGGRLPDSARTQLMPPDPGTPKPLVPDDEFVLMPSIQAPVELPENASLPIGDITAPLSEVPSSGPGSGGGIGKGRGTGLGSGNGPGAGTGDNGGLGNGHDGGIGDSTGPFHGGGDLTAPEILYKPTPHYTEDARKARTEGIVLLEVLIRANGTVDQFRIIRGLGHGLDESAIQTIATQWKFRPARYHGVPVDYPASIEVTFRLY